MSWRTAAASAVNVPVTADHNHCSHDAVVGARAASGFAASAATGTSTVGNGEASTA